MSQIDHDMTRSDWIHGLDIYWIYRDDRDRIFEVPTHLYCSLRRSMTPSKTQNRATQSNSMKEPVSQVLEKSSTGLFHFWAKVKHSVSGESEKPVPAAPCKQSSSAGKGLTLIG